MLYEIDKNYGSEAEKRAIIQLESFFKFQLIKLDYYDTFAFTTKKKIYTLN